MNLHIIRWSEHWESHPILLSLIRLRRDVFVVEQLCPIEEEPDANDPLAYHVCAVIDGTVVGCARILAKDTITAKFGRVAVARQHRKTGVGLAVMRLAITFARDLGYQSAYLESQTHAIPFYERLGFGAYGPEFDDCNIPHRKMTVEFTPYEQ